MTKNLTKVIHAENIGQSDLIMVRMLITTHDVSTDQISSLYDL